MNVSELIQRGDYLFGKRSGLLSLWQELADNFYVERSDFTVTRNLGSDFAGHLTTSYPLLVRRDLGDSISAILRPEGEQWVEITTEREDLLSNTDKRYLEMLSRTQYSAIYDNRSGFVRSTKEVDHDWVTFGQGVLTAEINWKQQTLMHRSWHLRDVVWAEDDSRRICEVHRKWACCAKDLVRMFPSKCDAKTMDIAKKEPYKEISCRHIVMEADQYYGDSAYKKRFKVGADDQLFVSVVIDEENQCLMEEVQRRYLGYVIPRFKTISGSQYAISPATLIALPDARTIQSIALSILEAGEMSVRPPLIAVPDALREDIQYRAGGITQADIEGDQQLKDVLAPIFQDRGGFNFGLEVMKDVRDMIASAFYINKLMLPPAEKEMTAYETSERISEHNRQVTPLFEPLLSDYNGELMELDFNLLMSVGAFGPPEDMPPNLRGQKIKWKFKNPLQESADKKKGTILQMGIELTAQAMQLDPNVSAVMNMPVALRDALEGIGTSPKHLNDEEVEAQIIAERQQAEQAAQAMQMAAMGGQAAEAIGKGGKELEAVA